MLPPLSTTEFLTGFLFFAVTTGSCAYAAWVVVARRMPGLDGVPRAVAFAICVVAVICLAHLVPAMLGVLTRGTVLGLSLALAVLAELLPRARAAPTAAPAEAFAPPVGADRPWQLGLAAAAAAAVSIWLLAATLDQVALPILGSDATNFHLPTVATWIQQGDIWHPRQFVAEQAQAYYPNTGNLMELAVMLPWRSDFLVRLGSVPMIALSGLGVFAAARELRATTATALLAGAAFVVIPIETLADTTLITPDPFMLATLSVGVFFLLRHGRTGGRSELILAGVALGLAFGSRWHGATAVVIVLAIWALAALLVERPRGGGLRGAALLGGLTLAVGGIWLLRNWIDTGSPVFPASVSPLGITIFDGPRDPVREQFGFALAHYATDLGVLRDYALDQMRKALGLPALAIALVGLAGAVPGARALVRRRPITALDLRAPACALAAIGIAIAYAFTPYTALGVDGEPFGIGVNTRYVVPALVLLVPVAAWAMSASGRLRVALELLFVLAIADGIDQGRVLGLAVDRRSLIAAAVLVGAVVTLALPRSRARLWRPLSRRPAPAAALGAAVAVVVLAVALRAIEDRYTPRRYLGAEPAIDYVLRNPASQSVALAGVWDPAGIQPPLPAFGPTLANDVTYLGDDSNGLPRPYRTRASFEQALRSSRADVLILGLSTVRSDPERLRRWVAGSGYEPVAESPLYVSYVPREASSGARAAITSIRSRKSGAQRRSPTPSARAARTSARARPGE